MRSLFPLSLCSALLVQAPDGARAEVPEFFVGPQISTLGFGGEVGVRLNPFLALRGGGNNFAFDFEKKFNKTDYDVDFELASAGALLDVHPLGTGFRISGGFRWNGNNMDLKATPNGSITIGDTTFSAAEAGNVTGDLDFNTFAPYAGLGFQGNMFGGWVSLAFDVGVLFQGDPEVDLKANGTLSGDPTLQAELDNEADEIEDDLQFLGFYPVAAITATVHF